MAADIFRAIEGLRLGKHFPDDAVLSTMAYKPGPGELFLVSYPKSGSTWTSRIMYNILMDAVDSGDPLEPLVRFPCLEIQGTEAAIYAPRPSCIQDTPTIPQEPLSYRGQIQRMKHRIAEATKGSDIMKLWENFYIP
ncbi:hypothetical protein MRX96_001912 [Rhipicephalus microplus]